MNLSPFLSELPSETDPLWTANTERQEALYEVRHSQCILLRGYWSDRDADPTLPVEGRLNLAPTRHARGFPKLLEFLNQFALDRQADMLLVKVVRLAPGTKVDPHVDTDPALAHCDRYHLVLQSPMGSPFGCETETIRMSEGEIWWFDNKKTHWAENPSPTWRTHVIFDLCPWQRIPASRQPAAQGVFPPSPSRFRLEQKIASGVLRNGRAIAVYNRLGERCPYDFDLSRWLRDGETPQLVATLFWQEFGSHQSVHLIAVDATSDALFSALVEKAPVDVSTSFIRCDDTGPVHIGATSIDPHALIIAVCDILNGGSHFEMIVRALSVFARRPDVVFSLIDFQTPRARRLIKEVSARSIGIFNLGNFNLRLDSRVSPSLNHKARFECINKTPQGLARFDSKNKMSDADDSPIFSTDSSGFLRCRSRTDDIVLWKFKLPGELIFPPLVSGRHVFLTCAKERVVVIDCESRRVVRMITTCATVTSPPTLINGRVYWATARGQIFEFEPESSEISATHMLPAAIEGPIGYDRHTHQFRVLTHDRQLWTLARVDLSATNG